MENQIAHNIKLGVFVSFTIILFATGIYFIGKKQQLFGQTFHLSGVFSDISGLQVGNNVRFTGITVGIVEDLEQLSDTTVRVIMLINKASKRFIKINAKAIVGSDGLMGNKIIIISPGKFNPREVDDNGEIQTVQPINMDDIFSQLKKTIDHSAEITEDLAAIMHSIRRGEGTIGKLFMDSTFAEDINQTVNNIKQGAGGFQKNMNAASHSFFLKRFFRKNKAQKK